MKPVIYCAFLLMLIMPFSAKSQVGTKGQYFLTLDSTLQNKVDSLMKIANSYYILGQLNISIEFYNKAINLNPNFAKAFYNRGNSNFDLGLTKQACEDWEKAKQLGDSEADMSFWKFCE